jgi:hypothetical protein
MFQAAITTPAFAPELLLQVSSPPATTTRSNLGFQLSPRVRVSKMVMRKPLQRLHPLHRSLNFKSKTAHPTAPISPLQKAQINASHRNGGVFVLDVKENAQNIYLWQTIGPFLTKLNISHESGRDSKLLGH